MVSTGKTPMRGDSVTRLNVTQYSDEKGRYLHEDEIPLGSEETEAALLRKVFERNGPGRYSIQVMRPKIQTYWTGWILDRGSELLIRLQVNDDGEYLHSIDELGLESLDYSVRGEVSIMKEGGA